MNYISAVLGTAAILIASTATLNWTLDPAGLFRKTSFGQQYAKALVASKNGLVFPDSLDEREIKLELAKRAALYDCVVIGSSHVMQIGSARKHRSFPACKNILNLGVGGAGIEDHVILAYSVLSTGNPRILILGIDPWTFAFRKDERWKVRYAEQYTIALKAIDLKDSTSNKSTNHWMSLISAQYTWRSMSLLLHNEVTPSIIAAETVDEDVGGAQPVMLPDGSYVYSAEVMKNAKVDRVPAGGESYKTDGVINELRAIDLYRRLAIWVRTRQVKPVFLMTPYHPNVWSLDDSPNVKAMSSTEVLVRQMGGELKIPVVGSFQPGVLGCTSTEFRDFMHPLASCVARFTANATF